MEHDKLPPLPEPDHPPPRPTSGTGRTPLSLPTAWPRTMSDEPIAYRVWPDGTCQAVEEGMAHSFMSDDFAVVLACSEEEACEKVLGPPPLRCMCCGAPTDEKGRCLTPEQANAMAGD